MIFQLRLYLGGGINEQFLKRDIHYKTIWKKEFPANSKFMKILTPQQLHALCVRDHYDIEVSYLEGPSARVISGCKSSDTKLVSWIHVEQHTMDNLAASFRNEREHIGVIVVLIRQFAFHNVFMRIFATF